MTPVGRRPTPFVCTLEVVPLKSGVSVLTFMGPGTLQNFYSHFYRTRLVEVSSSVIK